MKYRNKRNEGQKGKPIKKKNSKQRNYEMIYKLDKEGSEIMEEGRKGTKGGGCEWAIKKIKETKGGEREGKS